MDNYYESGSYALTTVFSLIVGVFYLFCMWRVFVKAGKPGWASIIPIYNVLVQLEIIGRPWWWLLLMFVPLVNIVIGIMMLFDLAKVFGKGTGFGFGLLFLSFIFVPILAFGDARYLGPIAGDLPVAAPPPVAGPPPTI